MWIQVLTSVYLNSNAADVASEITKTAFTYFFAENRGYFEQDHDGLVCEVARTLQQLTGRLQGIRVAGVQEMVGGSEDSPRGDYGRFVGQPSLLQGFEVHTSTHASMHTCIHQRLCTHPCIHAYVNVHMIPTRAHTCIQTCLV